MYLYPWAFKMKFSSTWEHNFHFFGACRCEVLLRSHFESQVEPQLTLRAATGTKKTVHFVANFWEYSQAARVKRHWPLPADLRRWRATFDSFVLTAAEIRHFYYISNHWSAVCFQKSFLAVCKERCPQAIFLRPIHLRLASAAPWVHHVFNRIVSYSLDAWSNCEHASFWLDFCAKSTVILTHLLLSRVGHAA